MQVDRLGIHLSLADIPKQNCYIRLSGPAKVRLCHMAGAPWAEKDPGATLHELQVEVLHRPERVIFVEGGSRLGKSVLGACELICAALLPFTNVAILSARYSHVNEEFTYFYRGMKSLFKGYPKAFDSLVLKNRGSYQLYHWSAIWSSTGNGYSAETDEGDVLLGKEFTHAVLGEGAKISNHVYERKLLRAVNGSLMNNDRLRKEQGYIRAFTTPSYDEGCTAIQVEKLEAEHNGDLTAREYGKVPFAETMFVRLAQDVRLNPGYDEAAYEAARKTASADAFAEQFRGERTKKTGAIYTSFSQIEHRVEMPSAEWIRSMRLGVGIDTGTCFAASLCGVDRDGRGWVLGEVYREKRTLYQNCLDVREMVTSIVGAAHGTQRWDDIIDRIDLWTVDPSSGQKGDLNELLEITVEHPGRNRGPFELVPTIEIVHQFMADDLFRIVDECTDTFTQLRRYVWKHTKVGGPRNSMIAVKEPVKADDHTLDAFRYILIPLMELGPTEDEPIPVTGSRTLRGFRDDLRNEFRRSRRGRWGDEIVCLD